MSGSAAGFPARIGRHHVSATALTASDDASKMKRWFARKSNYPTRCTRGPSRSARPGRYRWPSSPGEESNTSSAFMHPIRTPAATMEIGKIQETQGGDPSTMIRFLSLRWYWQLVARNRTRPASKYLWSKHLPPTQIVKRRRFVSESRPNQRFRLPVVGAKKLFTRTDPIQTACLPPSWW